MEWPKVYIVVLNWNGWEDTIECLASLLKLNYSNFQIVVIDNGSTDESVEKIKAWIAGKNIVLIETKQNLGYAGGNNIGLRYAIDQGDFGYAWILNNDTTVDPKALGHMVERMKGDSKIGICGSVILDYDERTKISGLIGSYDRWLGQAFCRRMNDVYDLKNIKEYKKLERKMDYVPGASMLVSKEFLNDIGLMCEDYFLFFEEIDWATRAKKKYTLALALESIVYHKSSVSIKKKEQEMSAQKKGFNLMHDRYVTRNRLLFTAKFFPYALPLVYISILGYLLDRLRIGAWDSVQIIREEVHKHFASLLAGKKTGEKI